jgi:hypothetical protein
VLTGSRLRWVDGRRALGRGGLITLSHPRRGRHTITLIATDGNGLRGQAQIVIRVG